MAIDYCGLALDAYGISVQKCVGTRDGQLLESDDGCKYILKQSRIKPEKIICAHIATQHLRKNGFLKATPYILDKNGLPFVLYANNCYTLAPSYVSRECSLENNEDLAAAAAILADMHNCSKGFTEENAELLFREYLPLFQESHAAADIIYKDNYSDEDEIDGDESSSDSPRYFKCELGRTADTFGRRLSELKRFRKIAKKRCDIFDYEYIAVADYYCNLADNVCRQLENSSYTEVTKRYKKEGCLCHRDFTGHNVLLAADPASPDKTGATSRQSAHLKMLYNMGLGGDVVLGFDSVCIEMPVYDLANFIRRRMRKCGWSISDAEFIFKKYDSVRHVNSDEIEILRLLLQFPQKLWRIVNKYYNSRRVWCEKSCLSKLEEVKSEREPLAEFSKYFLK